MPQWSSQRSWWGFPEVGCPSVINSPRRSLRVAIAGSSHAQKLTGTPQGFCSAARASGKLVCPAWRLFRKRADAVRLQSSEKFGIRIFIVWKCFVPNRGCIFLVHYFKRPAVAASRQSIYFYPHGNAVPRHASAKGRIFDFRFIVLGHVASLPWSERAAQSQVFALTADGQPS